MRRLLFTLVLLFATPAYADNYKILRVLDGDTVEIEAPFLPKPLKPSLLLRMEGIDTPEIGGKAKCPLENKLANQAKALVETELKSAKSVNVVLVHWDKFGGRVIGKIFVDGALLSDKLIAAKLAVPFTGKTQKKSWCN
jgi:endonuclease YncB( thermonuclease family)